MSCLRRMRAFSPLLLYQPYDYLHQMSVRGVSSHWSHDSHPHPNPVPVKHAIDASLTHTQQQPLSEFKSNPKTHPKFNSRGQPNQPSVSCYSDTTYLSATCPPPHYHIPFNPIHERFFNVTGTRDGTLRVTI